MISSLTDFYSSLSFRRQPSSSSRKTDLDCVASDLDCVVRPEFFRQRPREAEMRETSPSLSRSGGDVLLPIARPHVPGRSLDLSDTKVYEPQIRALPTLTGGNLLLPVERPDVPGLCPTQTGLLMMSVVLLALCD